MRLTGLTNVESLSLQLVFISNTPLGDSNKTCNRGESRLVYKIAGYPVHPFLPISSHRSKLIKLSYIIKQENSFLLTFLDQRMLGTGLPEALHSSVIVPPLRAVSCPLAGDVRMLGGTVSTKTCTEYVISDVTRTSYVM